MKAYLNATIVISTLLLAMAGYSQKGVGESIGVSRQGLNPEIVELEGRVIEVEIGPCKYTTGKSVSGTHLIMDSSGKTLNIHLGPTAEVSKFTEGIKGDEVKVMAFRTRKLSDGHYIAKELINGDTEMILRDNTLKPFWSGQSGRKTKAKDGEIIKPVLSQIYH